jgi:hypothetical protein
MSFVGGLLLGSFVVFHTLQQVVFKGWEHPQPEDACCVVSVVIAWLRNVQKHVLLSASGQNRDTASNKASSLTFLSFHALPTRCFLKNFECTVCFVNCVSYLPLFAFNQEVFRWQHTNWDTVSSLHNQKEMHVHDVCKTYLHHWVVEESFPTFHGV